MKYLLHWQYILYHYMYYTTQEHEYCMYRNLCWNLCNSFCLIYCIPFSRWCPRRLFYKKMLKSIGSTKPWQNNGSWRRKSARRHVHRDIFLWHRKAPKPTAKSFLPSLHDFVGGSMLRHRPDDFGDTMKCHFGFKMIYINLRGLLKGPPSFKHVSRIRNYAPIRQTRTSTRRQHEKLSKWSWRRKKNCRHWCSYTRDSWNQLSYWHHLGFPLVLKAHGLLSNM